MTEMNIFKGDSKNWEVTVKDGDGTIVDITGAEIVFTVRVNATDSTFSLQKKNLAAGGDATQISMDDPTNGIFRLHLLPSDTASLRASKYVYDFQLTMGTDVYTILKDNFLLKQDVT